MKSSKLLCLSGTAVLSLGLGISALAFTLLLAFSSLSYSGLRNTTFATVAAETEGGGSTQIAWKRFEELSDTSAPGVTLAAYSNPIKATRGGPQDRRPITLSAVSSGFFAAFTSGLPAGREFTQSEASGLGSRETILSNDLAVRLFGTPRNAVGRPLLLNDTPYQIVGVASPAFHGAFGEATDAWVPASSVVPLLLDVPAHMRADPNVWKIVTCFYGIAASSRTSSSGLVALLNRTLNLQGGSRETLQISQGLTTDPIRDERIRKWLRLGLSLSLVFTFASSLNVCLLLLARAPSYAEEIRLKRALGAQTVRIVLELLVGPAAMVLTGFLGAGAIWMGGLLVLMRTSDFYKHLLHGSWQKAFAAVAVQLSIALVLVLVALVPALNSLGHGSAPRMGYSSTPSHRTALWIQLPVLLQIACCIACCILAGMLTSSLISMLRQPLGYRPDNLTTVCIAPAGGTVTLTTGREGTSPEALALDRVMEQVQALPGVKGVSYTSSAPLDDLTGTVSIGRNDQHNAVSHTADVVGVSPGYFKTVGSRLLSGTDLSGRDSTGAVTEIVVNELLARELWAGQSPIDKVITINSPAQSGVPAYRYSALIVGVVENMRLTGFTGSYRPMFFYSSEGNQFSDIRPHLVVSGIVSRNALERVVKKQVPQLLPGMGIDNIYSVAEKAQLLLGPERERVYGALAGALTMALMAYIGLYGALSYYVQTRRRELAVRICLGASVWDVRKVIIRRAVFCSLAGALLSLPSWIALARISAGQYLGEMSWSTARAAAVTIGCICVSLLVSLAPASVASSTSPSEVLKEQ